MSDGNRQQPDPNAVEMDLDQGQGQGYMVVPWQPGQFDYYSQVQQSQQAPGLFGTGASGHPHNPTLASPGISQHSGAQQQPDPFANLNHHVRNRQLPDPRVNTTGFPAHDHPYYANQSFPQQHTSFVTSNPMQMQNLPSLGSVGNQSFPQAPQPESFFGGHNLFQQQTQNPGWQHAQMPSSPYYDTTSIPPLTFPPSPLATRPPRYNGKCLSVSLCLRLCKSM
ncbi:hypothetical protein BJ508DRAFT_328462 [Ascobolus immersus RN42]|uniref:Uncharacterized protein n=1 Tax=Ascobolus immersus RN42 TaxID=1160509 RepID=A0A3N4IBX5_ASCIM|nr:hypothetical protein BJ508DRAFT_328462 [Ascobolus immersus RN42]